MRGFLRRSAIGCLLLGSALAQSLQPDLFRKPPVDFYPSVFWAWNDAMTSERIREQLQDMQQHKLLTVCIEPMPRDFRPENTGNHLDVDYLSPEYFARYRLAMDETKRLGMKSWLYDEGGWPSGGATGRVVKSNPEFGSQTLITERGPIPNGEKPVTPPGAIAVFVEGGKTLVTCRIRRNDFQPDRLNPAATRKFIELTHEGYARAMHEYMGSLIPWAFTDEPAVPSFVPGKQIPWTAALPDIFRAKKGYDLMASLPLLLANPPIMTPQAVQARIDFFDVWSQLFQDAYLKPIRDWSRRNGILSGGHFGGDDDTMGSALHGYGHILRAMRGLDLPGVDTIWRQLFPGQRNHHFPRYAGSVSHQEDRHLTLTESFCVYGNGLTMAEMKWLINYQYVRGCNMTVMGNYPAGSSGNLMPGERPHFGPMNPLWRYQPLFQDYTARLGYALSLGQAATDVALYFPVRDFWAAAPAKVTPESQANDDTVLEMEKHQIDFDLVDDDLLAPSAVADGMIHVGKMSYRALVMSPARMLPDDTGEAVARFVRSGGTLVAAGALPETGPVARQTFLQHLGTEPFKMGERRRVGKGWVSLTPIDRVSRSLHPTIVLSAATDALRVTERRLPSGRLYVLINESQEWVTTTPQFAGPGTAKQCDLESGDITRAPHTLTLAPWGAVCILFDAKSYGGNPPPLPDQSRAIPIENEWQIRRVDQTVIKADDFARNTFAADPWRPAQLGDWKDLVGIDFSGTAEYRILFDYRGPGGEERFLDLGKVAAAADVWLNGEHLGARAWPPYWVHTKKALRAGPNDLRIQVTNTLANYLVSPAVRNSWALRKGPGWPGPYDGRANEFEKQSTASGLFGPVRLLAPARVN